MVGNASMPISRARQIHGRCSSCHSVRLRERIIFTVGLLLLVKLDIVQLAATLPRRRQP